MDPKRLGKFIADRRKELGLTQAQLSKKLYVALVNVFWTHANKN